jgi:hypothetical protein
VQNAVDTLSQFKQHITSTPAAPTTPTPAAAAAQHQLMRPPAPKRKRRTPPHVSAAGSNGSSGSYSDTDSGDERTSGPAQRTRLRVAVPAAAESLICPAPAFDVVALRKVVEQKAEREQTPCIV